MRLRLPFEWKHFTWSKWKAAHFCSSNPLICYFGRLIRVKSHKLLFQEFQYSVVLEDWFEWGSGWVGLHFLTLLADHNFHYSNIQIFPGIQYSTVLIFQGFNIPLFQYSKIPKDSMYLRQRLRRFLWSNWQLAGNWMEIHRILRSAENNQNPLHAPQQYNLLWIWRYIFWKCTFLNPLYFEMDIKQSKLK